MSADNTNDTINQLVYQLVSVRYLRTHVMNLLLSDEIHLSSADEAKLGVFLCETMFFVDSIKFNHDSIGSANINHIENIIAKYKKMRAGCATD